MDGIIESMIVGAVIFLAGMVANEILRNHDANKDKAYLPDIKPMKDTREKRRKEDYV